MTWAIAFMPLAEAPPAGRTTGRKWCRGRTWKEPSGLSTRHPCRRDRRSLRRSCRPGRGRRWTRRKLRSWARPRSRKASILWAAGWGRPQGRRPAWAGIPWWPCACRGHPPSSWTRRRAGREGTSTGRCSSRWYRRGAWRPHPAKWRAGRKEGARTGLPGRWDWSGPSLSWNYGTSGIPRRSTARCWIRRGSRSNRRFRPARRPRLWVECRWSRSLSVLSPLSQVRPAASRPLSWSGWKGWRSESWPGAWGGSAGWRRQAPWASVCRIPCWRSWKSGRDWQSRAAGGWESRFRGCRVCSSGRMRMQGAIWPASWWAAWGQ